MSKRAVILSAGQGSRLKPFTEDSPKCLLPLGQYCLLDWQIHELARCGIDDIAVVVGFRAEKVEKFLDTVRRPGLTLRTIYNPFYNVADNLGSCWLARPEMDRDFIVLNGDTVFEAPILDRLLKSPVAPITVTIDRKADYDADDMKVRTEGTQLKEIGKTLPLDRVDGESIGMLYFRGDGPHIFADYLDRAMRQGDGVKWWYLRVINMIAQEHCVETCSIEGLSWGEVDFPQDLDKVRAMVAPWETRRNSKIRIVAG